MARCGDGKLLFCVLFLSCCIATLAQVSVECCTDVSRKTIERHSVVDYRRQFKGPRDCSIDAWILVTRHGKELCVATGTPRLSAVIRHVDNLKKWCNQKKRYRHRRCSGVKPV